MPGMIYVVRHGQTDWNREGRLQGRQGLPLNETGTKQAEELRNKLSGISFDHVYSSPQERAVRTAAIVSGKSEVQIDARLDVYDLGEADGLLKQEVKLSGPIPDSRYYSGMEVIQSYYRRVFAFMEELRMKYGGAEAGENILIAGHRCTTGCIRAFFLGMPEDGNILKLSSNNGEYCVYSF